MERMLLNKTYDIRNFYNAWTDQNTSEKSAFYRYKLFFYQICYHKLLLIL